VNDMKKTKEGVNLKKKKFLRLKNTGSILVLMGLLIIFVIALYTFILQSSYTKTALDKLEVLDDEFSVENNRNPISFIKTRIKKPNSIYDKLQKMGYEFTTENIQTYLNDVAGVRIVCAFIDDIYMISDLITQQDDIKVIEIKDYIKNPKSNGYRSYHMIVEIPVFFAKGKTPMRVELQIRTNGMDFWATLEHQLRYKKGIEEMPGYDEISEELLHSARAIIEADNEMQRIKDKIGMFHEI